MKILFYGNEYGIGHIGKHNNFAIENNLNKNNFFIITGNLIAKNYNSDLFTYVTYNYWLDYPKFINDFSNINSDIIIPFDLKQKVLCYNRKARPHRKIIMYKILNNEIIRNNIIMSFDSTFFSGVKDDKILRKLMGFTNDAEKIISFFKNNIIKLNVDFENLSENLHYSFNLKNHQESFLSLVSETNIDEDILFFSEKIYKPMYGQQPFIIFGNPNSLKYLKKLGFKTFDHWWDESYDEETNLIKRIDKIIKVLENICSKNFDELSNMGIDMQNVLIHNYKQFLKLEASNDFLKQLGFSKFKTTKNILL